MAAVFAAFVLVLCFSDVALLIRFFSLKEKKELKEQIYAVSRLDLDDANTVIKALSDINEKYNFDVEIYNTSGRILYTTHGSQIIFRLKTINLLWRTRK